MHMFRTRFAGEIVAEFLPPARPAKKQKVIVLCDGMPGLPRKQALAEFLAAKGYWVFYPRYRGAWESGGNFLALSPHLDVLDVIKGLNGEIRELAFGKRFRVRADEVFVIGGSFGGAAAILCSLDPRVKKVIANCPVVDWGILRKAEKVKHRIRTMLRIFARPLARDIVLRTKTGRSSIAAISTTQLTTPGRSIPRRS